MPAVLPQQRERRNAMVELRPNELPPQRRLLARLPVAADRLMQELEDDSDDFSDDPNPNGPLARAAAAVDADAVAREGRPRHEEAHREQERRARRAQALGPFRRPTAAGQNREAFVWNSHRNAEVQHRVPGEDEELEVPARPGGRPAVVVHYPRHAPQLPGFVQMGGERPGARRRRLAFERPVRQEGQMLHAPEERGMARAGGGAVDRSRNVVAGPRRPTTMDETDAILDAGFYDAEEEVRMIQERNRPAFRTMPDPAIAAALARRNNPTDTPYPHHIDRARARAPQSPPGLESAR